ncbi:hypothetical protein NL676_012442 [Syzygium grande]|nr:hypothetical protein NL676_012442 [Syzygium grande]
MAAYRQRRHKHKLGYDPSDRSHLFSCIGWTSETLSLTCKRPILSSLDERYYLLVPPSPVHTTCSCSCELSFSPPAGATKLLQLWSCSSAFKERPPNPLSLWLCGYALQCLFRVGFVCVEYRWRDGDHELVDVSGLSRLPSRSRKKKKLKLFVSSLTISSSIVLPMKTL